VLHDDSLSDDLACVIAEVCLVQGMLDVDAGGGEVSEVHHRHEVEVAVKMAGVVPACQGEQLRDPAQGIERIAILLLRLGCHSFSPSDSYNLAEHGIASRRRLA